MRFSVTTERTSVVIGEQIQINAILISDKELKSIQTPTLPKSPYYKHLKTTSNQSQSSNIQIINGRMTQNVEITYQFKYILSMLKEGKFIFPALTISHKGINQTSKPFPITVGKETAQTKHLSVYLKLNKKQLYIGEQTVLTIEIAKQQQAPVNVSSQGFMQVIQNLENAFGKSFSINKLFTTKVGQSRRSINGIPHEIFSLAFSIIPIKAGNYAVSPVPFDYVELRQLQKRSRDPFSDFFGSGFFGRNVQQVAKIAHSNKLSITVKALPASPQNFSGAVGSFSINSSVSQTSIPAGEAITLDISLRGNTRPGNIADIDIPDLDDFEVFTPEKHTYIDTSSIGISTRKKYKYLIIPNESGEKTIPAITWIYFDPTKGAYKTLATMPTTISVSKGKKSRGTQTRYLTQEDIREIGRDIRYIKTPSSIKHQSSEPHKNPLFFVIFPIPFLIAIFALLYRLQATVLKKNPSQILKKRAYQTALNTLTSLSNKYTDTIPDNALSSIADCVLTYISHKFDFSALGKTMDELKETLIDMNIEQSVTNALIPFLEDLDSFRFSGTSTDKDTIHKTIEKSRTLIKNLEKKEVLS